MATINTPCVPWEENDRKEIQPTKFNLPNIAFSMHEHLHSSVIAKKPLCALKGPIIYIYMLSQ